MLLADHAKTSVFGLARRGKREQNGFDDVGDDDGGVKDSDHRNSDRDCHLGITRSALPHARGVPTVATLRNSTLPATRRRVQLHMLGVLGTWLFEMRDQVVLSALE